MRKGNALLIVIVIISILLMLAVILTKIVYNNYAGTAVLVKREEAWWLAEAGIAAGKAEIVHNPNWYTAGKMGNLGGGEYKIVREKDKKSFYALGIKGGAAVILRIEFTTNPIKFFKQREG